MRVAAPANADPLGFLENTHLCCLLLVSFLTGWEMSLSNGRIFLFSLSLSRSRVGHGEGGWASGTTSLLTAVT